MTITEKSLPALARTKLIKLVRILKAAPRVRAFRSNFTRYAPRHINTESFTETVGQSAIKSAVTSRVEEERQPEKKLEE